ncbi:hypothetical protein CCR75_000750 [Bremia lactucae]|uniref:Fe2OG dioxygenase domain-containing protein n=1 Tax=Bremia lactucae TaxID=4779 RepID=A0A976IIC9_BRELC|nr:hypothetical protein CCR75_000750 [Bremia lactucae]
MGKKKNDSAIITSRKTTKPTKSKSKPGSAIMRRETANWESDKIPPALHFEPLHYSLHAKQLHDKIFALPCFLTPAECQRVCSFAEQEGYERVTQRASREYTFLDNDRLLLRLPAFAELLWKRMQPHVPVECAGMHAVGLNPAIRLYRYKTGQMFGCHVDQSDVDRMTGYHSRFTVLVYLNDSTDSDLQGGNTIFYSDETSTNKEQVLLSVAPKTGLALVHGHGDQCLPHEGALVTRGAKYLLRTDVMYSKKDK